MNDTVCPPSPRVLVDRARVEQLIAAADAELSVLEAEVQRARTSADELEARFDAEDADERSAAWLLLHVDRFVTELRAAAETEAAELVFEAHARARALLEEARLPPGSVAPSSVAPSTDAPEADAPRAAPVLAEVPRAPATAPSADDLFQLIRPVPLSESTSTGTMTERHHDAAHDEFDDPSFWSRDGRGPRRFRPVRPAVAMQLAALSLVAAAAVVRFA
jgi:hypothetical protein